ncbi:MAG: 4Fe-4S dicluster domain-containing protein [Proteobacteria bacterium]|nr:4Fe-4S dicluster domain-containing protein [Pseudomonadota bacterium]NIS68790.1 4Fe-4S dicluster domain-containing protein [Pseudomonadota bacterium]
MRVDLEKCTGCGSCAEVCPLETIGLVEKKALIGEDCVDCGACQKVCPKGALQRDETPIEDAVPCAACPIFCQIKPGKTGACHRFINKDGILVRSIPLHRFEDVEEGIGPDHEAAIRKPLITGIGAGTTYPDYKPAPHIARATVEGVDVVTVVTEAPLSYSGIKVKIDTDRNIGQEGSPVLLRKKKVGHVTSEEYGSKMLSLGGVNLLTGKDGMIVARLIADIANREPFSLSVKDGAELDLQVGGSPLIDGETTQLMRVGCGSASMGLFAPYFLEAADEVVVLDSHLIGLFTEHTAGKFIGARYSGVRLKARMSTLGRYFGEHGKGWGGTPIENPLDIVEGVDHDVARPGMTLLITETTGERSAMFRLNERGRFEPIKLSEKARRAVNVISETCQPSRVSAIFVGGTGGSARAGVTRYPVRLNEAIHNNRAKLTVGGAPVFILPGGGINFLVDVEKVKVRAFTWVPTPAPVVPIEYTMRTEDYLEIGGHRDAMRPLHELLMEIEERD